MQRIRVALSCGMLMLLASPASAQDYKPRHGEILKKALDAVGDGRCPPELMTPILQYQCEKQVVAMSAHFKKLGEFVSLAFRGTQQSPQGPGEVYLATYRNGEMVWLVAVDPDGKLNVFWTPG